MPFFHAEPPHTHGSAPRIGVLLVNLGTPDAPEAGALRRYLRQFLSDRRVVELPRLLWLPILYGIILNTRPARSAKKYAAIWSPDGSPLAAHTQRQAKLLKGYLGQAGHQGVEVLPAMCYGQPALATQMDALRAGGCTRILVIPLYPQYAASTTGAVADALADWIKRTRNLPELRLLRGFCDEPGYIAALEAQVREHWQKSGRGEHLVISFHGTPRRSLDLGDPYYCECQKTARLLAQALRLKPEEYRVCFQSRFGRAQWLEPYTQPTLTQMAQAGVKTVDIICPGFVSDCLETLEEITLECKESFRAAGGSELRYIPCLNERDDWIKTLQTLSTRSIGDWLATPAPSAAALEKSAEHARRLGATR